jgi:hypothetical protein
MMNFEAKPFSTDTNIIMACHITGVYDVNRNTTLEGDNYELVKNWAESVADLKLCGIIFHNNFTSKTCEKFQNDYVSFVNIEYNPQFNPNVYRYFVYKNFIQQQLKFVKNIFVTDISDVVVLKNPFEEKFFKENPTSIFCGDEPKKLLNEWMQAHSANLREKITDYAAYEQKFADATLLNCGIIGGEGSLMFAFLRELCSIHQHFNFDNKSEFTGDMGAFNYLIRTKYNKEVKHGAPINTVFKMYESERSDCWFKHK